ncbi:DUF3102 domain-containing protein [Bradyrhizobium sp. 186]|uniref:DUF3102 domain-containing protein n=1 Tax=Bradyrhizobium sp. 186 TaxID=2782654 RepID=UPI002001826D|nr:DUF3102 domain-containing protein [Bradyrhizobium sp. 186]UPK32838.1 DUF3102 domain-containing protein [Bradyrhizobium sp. 186]
MTENIDATPSIVKPDIDTTSILADHAVAIRRLAKRAQEDIVEIGRHLHEARELLEGQWLAWLDSEFGWSDQTARRFIHVFELSRDGKFNNLLNLDLPISVLYLLAAPKAEAARKELATRYAAGEQLTFSDVRDVLSRQRAQTEASAAADSVHHYDWRTGKDDHPRRSAS